MDIKNMSRSSEDYLEAIYNLEIKNGVTRVTDLAEVMGVSKPSVNQALTVLSNMGLIRYEKYEPVSLTDKGIKKAKDILKIHNLIKDFLINVLDVPEEIAGYDACRMEHIISSETINGIINYMKK